jgi:hypothetical protein
MFGLETIIPVLHYTITPVGSGSVSRKFVGATPVVALKQVGTGAYPYIDTLLNLN